MFERKARWVCDRCGGETERAIGTNDDELPEGWILFDLSASLAVHLRPRVSLHLCSVCVDRVLRVLVDEAPPAYDGRKPAGTVVAGNVTGWRAGSGIAGSPRHRAALLSIFSDARRSSE